MSLGGTDPLDPSHLRSWRELIESLDPVRVSEHACWSSLDGTHFNDLLPLPFTAEAADVLVRNIDRAQTLVQRPLLIENLSGYVAFRASTIPEWEFLATVCDRAGCGLVLDLNNIVVSAANLDFDPET